MSLWPTSEVEYNPRPFLSALLTLCKLPNSSACYILASSHFEAVSQPSVFSPSCARCDVHHVTGSSKYWIVCVCIKEGMVKNPSDNKWLSALCNISSLSGDTRLVSCCSPNTKKAPESFSGIISQPFFAEKKRCLHHSWKVTSFPFYEVQWPNLNHSTNESLNSQPQTEPC